MQRVDCEPIVDQAEEDTQNFGPPCPYTRVKTN